MNQIITEREAREQAMNEAERYLCECIGYDAVFVRDEERSEGAGYPVLVCSTPGVWISDLGCRIEANPGDTGFATKNFAVEPTMLTVEQVGALLREAREQADVCGSLLQAMLGHDGEYIRDISAVVAAKAHEAKRIVRAFGWDEE